MNKGFNFQFIFSGKYDKIGISILSLTAIRQ